MKEPQLLEIFEDNEMIDITPLGSSATTQFAGRTRCSNCVIQAPELDDEDRTWHLLKYGVVNEFKLGVRIENIEIGNLILGGVYPLSQQDDIFICSVDYCYAKPD